MSYYHCVHSYRRTFSPVTYNDPDPGDHDNHDSEIPPSDSDSVSDTDDDIPELVSVSDNEPHGIDFFSVEAEAAIHSLMNSIYEDE